MITADTHSLARILKLYPSPHFFGGEERMEVRTCCCCSDTTGDHRGYVVVVIYWIVDITYCQE